MTRDRKLAQRMAGLLGRWASSGESLKSFAEAEGESYWRLRYWKKKLGKRRERRCQGQPSGARGRGSMVPVQVLLDGTGRGAGVRREHYVVRLPSGVEVEVPRKFELAELSDLLRVVGSC